MRRPVLTSLLIGLALAMPVPTQAQVSGPGLAGPYLAARAAVFDGNHLAAATYFENAIAADPNNPRLVGNAIFANAALGRWGRAVEFADMLNPGEPGQELANLAYMVRGLNGGDFIGARSAIEAGQGAGPFIDDLALGWLYVGEGDMAQATAAFLSVAQDQGLADIALTHLGYARAAVGDYEGAHAILSGEEAGALSATERSLRARAEVLVQLGRTEDALELLDLFVQSVPDPAMLRLRNRIADANGGDLPYTFIQSAEAGAAEVFYSVARALGSDGGSTTLPLMYTRAAQGIFPEHTEALLFAGQILSSDGQFALAADAYAEVPAADDQYIEAQLGRSDALFDDGQEEEAIAGLAALSEANPELATIHASLGDLQRRFGDCAGAIDSYTDALDLIDTTQERYWFLFYTRGICYSSEDNFDAAEADFRQALVLNPNQPQVLNNLGYSLVEERRNFDEALDMIERAVAGRPDSGYIVDSLGWVLYRLGRFEEAVEPMERAVELLPNDPIINDHLGDVYWMVGRYREAEFQWHRALSFEPEDADAERIRRKLDVGLYEVLEAEGGVGAAQ